MGRSIARVWEGLRVECLGACVPRELRGHCAFSFASTVSSCLTAHRPGGHVLARAKMTEQEVRKPVDYRAWNTRIPTIPMPDFQWLVTLGPHWTIRTSWSRETTIWSHHSILEHAMHLRLSGLNRWRREKHGTRVGRQRLMKKWSRFMEVPQFSYAFAPKRFPWTISSATKSESIVGKRSFMEDLLQMPM